MRVIEASEPPPRADLVVSVGLGCWLVLGLFIDGWAHRTPGLVDSFFTPWHAILYAGYLANAGWIATSLWRTNRSLRVRDIRIPSDGVLGVWGLLTFGIGGFFDVLWHAAAGIERGLEVFFTPPHLMLFIGASLTLMTPFRATWARRDETAPSLSAFLPAVVSLGLTMSVVSFFVSYSWGFFGFSLIGVGEEHRWSLHFLQSAHSVAFAGELRRTQAVTSILLTNLVIVAPVLLIVRRWRPPFGTFTILLALNALFMAALSRAEPIVVALCGGLIADLLVRWLRPSLDRPTQLRAFSALMPAGVWTLYFLVILLGPGLAWSWPLWTGTIVWTALEALALGLVMVP